MLQNAFAYLDFIVLSGNSSRIWLFPLVGIAYDLVILQPVPPTDRQAEFKYAGARYRGYQLSMGGSERVATLVAAFDGKTTSPVLTPCTTWLRISVADGQKSIRSD